MIMTPLTDPGITWQSRSLPFSVHMFEFSIFHSLNDTHPKYTKGWKRFIDLIEKDRVVADKKNVHLYSPAIYVEGATREIFNVDYLTFGVADIDSATEEKVDEVLELLKDAGLYYLLHTTHSHVAGLEEGKYKCRIIFKFNRKVETHEWDQVWWGLNELCLGTLDKQCRNPNAIYFWPSSPPGHTAIILENEGKSIDIDGLLEDTKDEYKAPGGKDAHFKPVDETLLARIDVATRVDLAKQFISKFPPAIEGEGGDKQTLRAGFIGKDFALKEEEFLPLFLEYNKRCDPPWSEKDLQKKLANAYKYSQRPFGWRLVGQEQTDTVLKGDVQALIKELQKKKHTAADGRILRSMLAGEAIAETNPVGTLGLMAKHLAKKFTTAHPPQVVTHFQACLDATNNRDVNAETFAERIKDAQEQDQADKVRLKHEHELEELKTLELAWLQQGIDRKTPYTEKELDKYAKRFFDGDVRTLKRHLIIRNGRAFYFFFNGKYIGPYTSDDAHSIAVSLLSPMSVPLVEFKQTGPQPMSLQTLVDKYGQIAKTVVADMTAQRTTFNPEGRVLTEATCPRRKVIPTYHPHVDLWLQKLCGVNRVADGQLAYTKLQAWLASLSRINKPCAALYLYGEPGTGKSMLGHACARLWTTDGPTELEDVAGNFNSRLASCPLVLGDESVPKDTRGIPRTDLLRKLIQEHTRTYRRKFIPDSTLKGSMRLVIAANTLDHLTSEHQSLNAHDIAAIVERFLLISIQDQDARDFFKNITDKERRSITDGLAVVEHAMWLKENFEFERGARFLVEGIRNSELETKITTSSGLRSEVCEWVAMYVTEPNRVGGQRRNPIVHNVNGVPSLLINPTILHSHWQVYIHVNNPPKKAYLGKALEGLTAKDRVDVGGESYSAVQMHYIKQWVIDKGHCTQQAFRDALKKLGLPEEGPKPGALEKKNRRWG